MLFCMHRRLFATTLFGSQKEMLRHLAGRTIGYGVLLPYVVGPERSDVDHRKPWDRRDRKSRLDRPESTRIPRHPPLLSATTNAFAL